ncbi:MAG: hypothetical protein V7K26_01300 [Nostoc sp.]|uniref:hypothetical protein n=1 Tax=Nostoc sp. TaxID=1180 RepID=UPI002FF35B59
MTTHIETHQINTELTLHDSLPISLNLSRHYSHPTKQDNELIACRLTFELTPQLYQRIDTEALFNFKPEARSPKSRS